MKKIYDLIGIGNPIVDYTASVGADFLKEVKLRKDSIKGVADSQHQIEKILKGSIKKSVGGSPGNVVAGAAHLGLKTVFCGAVGCDENAELIVNDLEKRGIENYLVPKDGSTGVAITLITPDKERTFIVNPGVCSDLVRGDLPLKKLKQSKYLHTSGYELKSLGDVLLRAMKEVKKSNGLVSFDGADPRLIGKNLAIINKVLEDYVDIIFLNEEEAKALTGKSPKKAVEDLSKRCEIVVVKLGQKGAIIQKDQERHRIKPFKVDVCNTNGAGDAFAAGFLYGLVNEYDFKSCGILGSYYASKVVAVESARLEPEEKLEGLSEILK